MDNKEIDRTKIQQHFGLNVRKYRLENDISQEYLAEKATLHRTYIGSVERGERNVSLINIWKIAKALNIPVELLFISKCED